MKKAIIISSIVILLGAGVYFFYKRQVDALYDMGYNILGFQVNKVSETETIVNVKVRITSDSTIEAEVRDVDLDAYIDGIKCGKVYENSVIVIPAKGYSDIDIKVVANLKEIGVNGLTLLGQLWANKDAMLTLKGTARVKTAFLSFKVPVDYTESIKYLLS